MSTPTVVSVVGFVFWRGQVLLVRKARPFWQAGKLNGVGGKVEEGETTVMAMVRECHEETSVVTSTMDWEYVAKIEYSGGRVQFFRHFAPDSAIMSGIKNPDPTEPLGWYPWANLPNDVLPNLRWLIPFCQDRAAAGPVGVWYDKAIAHALGDNALAASVGKRHFVTTKTSGPVIGTVSGTTGDGVTLTHLRYPGDTAPDPDASLAIGDHNLEVFIDVEKLNEKQLLLIAERMYQDGVRAARKE